MSIATFCPCGGCERSPDKGICRTVYKGNDPTDYFFGDGDRYCGTGYRGNDPRFNCYDTMRYKYSLQPDLPGREQNYNILNSEIGVKPAVCTRNPDPNKDTLWGRNFVCFQKTNCPESCRIQCHGNPECLKKMDCKHARDPNCGKREAWQSRDPRLVDPIRAIRTTLDRPPYDGSVDLDDLYTEGFAADHRAGAYDSYEDIHAGQVMYYNVDAGTSSPYFEPIFVSRASVGHDLYQDPMGSVKPHYPRTPISQDLNYVSNDSFTRDTVKYREDILEGNMVLINQNKYSARYS